MVAFAKQLAEERPEQIALRDSDRTLTWAELAGSGSPPNTPLLRTRHLSFAEIGGTSRRIGKSRTA
jgi:hypothetical protein